MVNKNRILIMISKPEGVFRLSGELHGDSEWSEKWSFEARATTKKGRTVQAGLDLLHEHRREIVAMFNSARYVCRHYGRKHNY